MGTINCSPTQKLGNSFSKRRGCTHDDKTATITVIENTFPERILNQFQRPITSINRGEEKDRDRNRKRERERGAKGLKEI